MSPFCSAIHSLFCSLCSHVKLSNVGMQDVPRNMSTHQSTPFQWRQTYHILFRGIISQPQDKLGPFICVALYFHILLLLLINPDGFGDSHKLNSILFQYSLKPKYFEHQQAINEDIINTSPLVTMYGTHIKKNLAATSEDQLGWFLIQNILFL